jgi:hypothetical protein
MYFNWLEFVLWEHEVAGSSPVIPTIKIKNGVVDKRYFAQLK